uniref:Consortin C-terminal domain-containing protein n=1 Tax=Oryzias latipes TaxID=8090 RepID=A0A3P9K1E3_ORYLA
MDQSKPAEQQGEDSHPGREKEETGGAEEEDCGVEEAAEALELEDGGAEDEWTEKQEEASFCLTALPTLPLETLAGGSGAEISPASGLVSILKKRVNADAVDTPNRSEPVPKKGFAQRRVRFKVPDDSYDNDLGGGDSCLLLFLLCLVTVVISVGGTALYCALGDTHSSVCQDFTSNADFYIRQIHRGMSQLQHWFAPGS